MTSGQSEVTAGLGDRGSAAAARRFVGVLVSVYQLWGRTADPEAWIKLSFFAIRLHISCLLSISNQLPPNQ